MYLFLVDYNYISSENLQKMISQVLPEEDVVNCFSPATLLKISEKLKPDLVIIDFALVKEGKIDLINILRNKCPDTYILAMIETDYYEQLYQAIEKSLIDDYIVKPVSEDEFAARILITSHRRKDEKPPLVALPPEQPAREEEEKEEEKFVALEHDEPEEPEVQTTADPSYSSFEETMEPMKVESDFSALSPEEDFFSHTAEENLEVISSEEIDLKLPDQSDIDLEILDLPDQVNQEDDFFSEQFDRQDKEEAAINFDLEDPLETPKAEKEPGEFYFNDLFLEEYEVKDPAEKIPESETLPPAPVDFDQLDDATERDINISIKDFMPGESADQYLKERDAEAAISYNEDLLNRFLSDEEELDEEENDYEKYAEPSGLAQFFSVIINVFLALLLLMMASLSFFLIHNRVADGPPSLAGFTFHVMKDDNLNADVNPGSLAVVRSTDITAVSLGDVISFRSPVSPTVTITQRVVEINRDDGLQFVTSGNGSGAVQTIVPAENVSGKALFLVPYYGRMVDYVQTSQGLILLIFVPGVIIILYQLVKIIRHLSDARRSGSGSRYHEVIEE